MSSRASLARALFVVVVYTATTSALRASAGTEAASQTLPQTPAYLGIAFTVGRDTSSEIGRWLTVQQVTAGGPADRAGVVRGDLIVAIASKSIAVSNDLDQVIELARLPINKPVKLSIVRKGEKRTITLVPEPMSAVMQEHWKAMIDAARREQARQRMNGRQPQ